MFDDQPDCDPHGECAREIHILRGLLLWALYHHQGASSAVGQPIRQALGIGQYERMTDEQIAMAKEAAAFGVGHNASLTGAREPAGKDQTPPAGRPG